MSRYVLFWTALSIFCICLIIAHPTPAATISIKTYIPKNAPALLPLVAAEQKLYFPDHPLPPYFGGLIEQESCINLTHKRCWNAKAQLKSKRELGIGLGQLTKAYNSNGSVRFDSLIGIRRAHIEELNELSWESIPTRPDLQIRALILMSRDNYKELYNVKDTYQRLAMADAAYNGGLGGVNKERRTCGMSKGCNAQVWFKNVERYCMKSKRILYGNRNACDINREHVRSVLEIRTLKYAPFFTFPEQKAK